MSELTYEDFKQRINIQEVLQDAGYHLNRKDGIRYPSYVRLDSNGRLQIHGHAAREMLFQTATAEVV